MSKTNAFESDLLSHIFENDTVAGIGDATGIRGASVAGSLYIALHTADPTDTGSMAAEADYTGYARKAVARTAAAWSESGGTVTNDAAITFNPCTGGTNTITHFSICKAGTAGVADAIYTGAVTPNIAISNGITPEVSAGQLSVTEG